MAKPKVTIAHHIMSQLGKQIITGKYSDDMLPGENELATQFSASRTSIRNALQALAGKGLITIQPKKRSVINHKDQWNFLDQDILKWIELTGVSPELFEQLIILRLIFEPNAAALAAIHANGHDLAVLESALHMMKDAQTQNRLSLFEQGDIKFHHAVLSACHNPFLQSISSSIGEAMILSFKQTQEAHLNDTEHALEQHQLLFEAIRLKDHNNSRNLMKNIILRAVSRHLPSFDLNKYNHL